MTDKTSIRASSELLDKIWELKKDRTESNEDVIWRLIEEAGYDVEREE